MFVRPAAIALILCACTGTNDPGKGGDTDALDTLVTGETDEGDDSEPADPSVDVLADGTTWRWSSHPCDGNRVDTLLRTSDDRLWVGCGSDSAGQGLHTSSDDGETWHTPSTTTPDYFTTFRVNDLFEGEDGRLYIAGDQTSGANGSDAVVSVVLPAVEPLEVSTVFATGNQVWNSFPVGTYRRLSDGQEVAESLTGNGAVWRDDAGNSWQDGSNWALNGTYQILDLEVYDGGFYGVGSTIANPPMVYVPPTSPVKGFGMDEIVLTNDFDGEMWDLVVDAQGMLAVGVDQDGDVGALFFTSGDGRAVGSWTMVKTDFETEPTWLNGACRSGDTWVAVGRLSQRDKAFAIVSTDAGATWNDISPADRPALYGCMFEGGSVLVAGAGGALGRLTLP